MELTKRIDSVFCRWDHPDTPGGQVLVKHHGKVIYDLSLIHISEPTRP